MTTNQDALVRGAAARTAIASLVAGSIFHISNQGEALVGAHLSDQALAFWLDDDDDFSASDCSYEITDDGVAIIPVVGVMVDCEPSWWMSYLGYTSTPAIARMIEDADTNANVKDIYLYFDCPGGEVSGATRACDAIWRIREKGEKRIIAACKMACSLAFELASQCETIYLAQDGMAGCLGTLYTPSDWSVYFQTAGVKVLRITSDGAEEYKGEGTRGTEITPAQQADYKRICNEYREIYNEIVARGRGYSDEQLKAMADGRTYIGRYALAMELVDEIASPDDVLALLGSGADLDEDTNNVPPDNNDPPPARSQMAVRQRSPTLRPHNRASAQPTPTASAKPEAVALSQPVQQPIQGKETKMRDKLVQALTRWGKGIMALAVMNAKTDDAEELASIMAAQVDAEAEKRVGEHPLIVGCKTLGLSEPADFLAIKERADLGDAYLKELRETAKTEAVRAYGAEQGPIIAKACETMSAANVKTCIASYKATADHAANRDPETGRNRGRQTAPAARASAEDVDDDEEVAAVVNTDSIYAARRKAVSAR